MIPGFFSAGAMIGQNLGPVSTYSPWDVSALPANVVASEGDYRLDRSGGSDATRIVAHPVTRTSGKYSLRFLARRSASTYAAVGVRNGSSGSFLGGNSAGWGFWAGASVGQGNRKWHNNLNDVMSGPWITGTPPNLSEMMIDLDINTGSMWMGVDGVWLDSGNPAAGTGAQYTNLSGTIELVADMYYDATVIQLLTPDDFITPATSGFTPGWPD